jgi:hypothetical protein
VLVHASVATDQLKKEEFTHTIQPRHRMRTINFRTEAVRAAIQPNSTHDDTAKSLDLIQEQGDCGVRTTWLTPVYNRFAHDLRGYAGRRTRPAPSSNSRRSPFWIDFGRCSKLNSHRNRQSVGCGEVVSVDK